MSRPERAAVTPTAPTGENWKDVRKEYRRPEPKTTERARLPIQYDDPPAQRSSQTSTYAAERIAPTFGTKMFLVHEHIKAEGARGATREEISVALEMRLSTVCGAVRKLYLMGFIGSNCVNRCKTTCDHDVVSRLGTSGLPNEVMVDERYVVRWMPDQNRTAGIDLGASMERDERFAARREARNDVR